MRPVPVILGAVSVAVLVGSFASILCAEQVRYMDSAGNIHFVDRLRDVPRQYQLQVVTPTPTPVLDKRAIADLKRKQADAEREKMRKESERNREMKRRRDEADRERRREERELRRSDDNRRVDRSR